MANYPHCEDLIITNMVTNNMTIGDALAEVMKYMIPRMLESCTEPQRGLFYKIFPNGVVPDADLNNAIDLLARTMRKNAKRV